MRIRPVELVPSAFALHERTPFVDTCTPFPGHELAYIYIISGNVLPNATGYAAIAAQIEAIPEPSTLLVVGAGLTGWLVLGRRLRDAGRRSPAS